ncbi:thiamine phosphate synthase [Luteimonas sp. e5]
MSSMPFPARGLYLLTPDSVDGDTLPARIAPLLPHVAALQYRNKLATADERLRQARALRELCREAGVCFIVNDDMHLAREVDADGVHLGRDDGDIATARALLGAGRVVGASCYDELQRAHDAAQAGADYIAFGALFASATKPQARRAMPVLFTQAAALGVPRVAIGGITADNAGTAVALGADVLAVIGGVFDARDPIAAARTIAAACNPNPSSRESA